MEIFQLFQDIVSFDEQGKLSIRYDNELSQVWVRLPEPPTKYLVLYIAVAGDVNMHGFKHLNSREWLDLFTDQDNFTAKLFGCSVLLR